MSSRRSPFGAAVRIWVGNTLVALAFLGFLAVSTVSQWDLDIVATVAAGTVAMLAVVGVGLTGRRLAMTGRKMRAAIAAGDVLHDPRRPVIYLRSFATDQVLADANIAEGFIQLSTEEEQYAQVFNRIGPFVAIGDPREALPDLGAARMYVGNAGWRVKVDELLAHARLVVLRVSATEGLLWELHEALAKVDPERLLMLIPKGRDRYPAVKKICDPFLGKPLPDLPKTRTTIGTLEAIVRFSPDWTAEFLPTQFHILNASMRSPIAPTLQYMLRPVFEQVGVAWTKPRLGITGVFIVTLISIGALIVAGMLISSL